MMRARNAYYRPPAAIAALCMALALTGGGARAADAVTSAILNIRSDFGAVGDGEADDTEAVQQAFRAAAPVYMPPGVYRVTSAIRVRARTKIYGAGCEWNAGPESSTVIRYDGPPDGMVLRALEAHYFQMRNVQVSGDNKAAIGIYWNYSTHTILEDVTISGTLQHGLYVTRTWYSNFNRLYVRGNQNNGITLDRDTDERLAKGPVNYVNFHQCYSSHNGRDLAYDGRENIALGYGFGSRGYNNMINVTASVFENNGGAGVYLDGPENSSMLFQGSYFERNCIALRQDDNRTDAERTMGYIAHIIDNTTSGSNYAVFDTCYLHPYGGIWLRGPNSPQFRNIAYPMVIWTDAPDTLRWDGPRRPPSAREPGVIYHEGGWKWHLPAPEELVLPEQEE